MSPFGVFGVFGVLVVLGVVDGCAQWIRVGSSLHSVVLVCPVGSVGSV